MNKEIKAVFFDIDGTLVSFNTHRMPENTRRTLDTLREKGILTFVATGRQLASINNLGTWVPDGYITMNGSVCVMGGETVYKLAIDPEDVRSMAAILETEDRFPCIFIYDGGICINYVNDTVVEVMRLIDMEIPPVKPLDEICRRDVFQMLAFFGEEQEEAVMERMPRSAATRWTPLFTDIIPAESGKWNAISKVIGRLGITREETMAFGDGGNDVSMLRGAGIGVAMGNADEHVKAEADWVTDSVDDDGITKALKHFKIL